MSARLQKKEPVWIMKWIKNTCVFLVSLILLCVFTFVIVWKNEILSVLSFKVLCEKSSDSDGNVYMIDINGGFYLEDFINQGGVSSDEELSRFITNKITRGLFDINIDSKEIACAAFTASDKSGDKLLARNYDLTKTNTCIVKTKGVGERHSTISTVDLSFLGISPEKGVNSISDKLLLLASPYIVLDGINDAGVSCSINMSYQEDSTNQTTQKPDITSTSLLRLILDYADDVDEAVEIAQAYDMHDSAGQSFHYIVADSNGNSAVLMYTCGTGSLDNDGQLRKFKVIYGEQNQVITNFIIQPEYYIGFEDWEIHGLDRYNLICDRLNEVGGVVEDEKSAMSILSEVGARKWYENSDAVTVHSAVYNMTDKTVMWVPNEHFENSPFFFNFD